MLRFDQDAILQRCIQLNKVRETKTNNLNIALRGYQTFFYMKEHLNLQP